MFAKRPIYAFFTPVVHNHDAQFIKTHGSPVRDVPPIIFVPILLMASIPLGLGALQLVQRNKPATAETVMAAAPTPAPKISMPGGERAFLVAVAKGRDAFNAGRNEMARGSARPLRARAICDAVSPGRVDDWIGKVASLSTNGDGKGVLAIEIGSKILVKTWNNAVSDISDQTLLDPDSPIYKQALSLTRGQRVQFSGDLFANSTDCVRESSMTLQGSLTEPEFIFRFSDLRPL